MTFARSAGDLKVAAVRQWTDDPAGAYAAAGLDPDSREFFEAVERHRYALYPWLREYLTARGWAGRRVLEVGVGLGTDHLQLARAGAVLSGVDLTPRSVERTARRFELYGAETELQVADAENLPFASASFDAVYSFGVLHHTPGMRDAIREVGRVLRPGGRALIGVYNRHSYFYAFLLARHVVRGDWLSSSIGDLKARIEHGPGKPLVLLSSRRELEDMFRPAFTHVAVEARHLPRPPVPERVRGSAARVLDELERRFGWYWMVDARAG